MTKEIQTLIILGLIVLSLIILLILYLFIALRKAIVATKKIDYFVEDATYKLEKLNTTIDAINKLSAYAHIFELFLEQNSNTITEYLNKDESGLKKFENFIKKEIDNNINNKTKKEPKKDPKLQNSTKLLDNNENDFDENIEVKNEHK